MTVSKTIIILATLDTKGAEAAFVKARCAERGFTPLLLDLGVMGDPAVAPDISREEVARAAGTGLAELRAASRDEIMERMGAGAGRVLKGLHEAGRLDGVIGLGGNQGTAMACRAMQMLPLGVPKVMVSTVASGDTRPYIGAKDIAMFFAVADLLGGPNPVSRSVLSQAAGALGGMVLWGEGVTVSPGRPVVALTALGNTHPAITRCLARLHREGCLAVTFHASGACGTAMEELITEGRIDAVLDLTPHELVGEVLGHDIYTPVRSGRLMAAGRRGIPQVISTGGLDYYCLGPKSSIPPELQDRTTYMHNPQNANVMLTAEELGRLGQEMAERLSASTGPVAMLVPLRGWSEYGREAGPLWNPKGRAAFLTRLKARLHPRIPLVELDCHINDPPFADACVDELKAMLAKDASALETGGSDGR
jgi:uncharacterized protein (UPF0261 family)